MRDKGTQIQRPTLGLLPALLCCAALAFTGCHKPDGPTPAPKPPPPGALLSDLEIVKVRVEKDDGDRAYGSQDSSAKTVDPPVEEVTLGLNFTPPANEPAIIFFFTEDEGPLPGQPDAVRWEFAGLEEGQTVYITPKEGQSITIFNFPDTYKGEPAFALSLPNDTIYSGPAVKETWHELFTAAEAQFTGGEQLYVSWFYDVDVVDSYGEVVASYDPEVRIKKYP